MTDSELTVSILRDIRDSIRTLDSNVSSRIDATNERLETVEARLSLVESAVREGAAQTLLLTRYLKNKTEVEVADLRERVARLEAKVG